MTKERTSNARASLIRELVFEADASFSANMENLELDELRRSFAPMFDRAARAVEDAGFSQDDSVIGRWIRCRDRIGREWLSEAESLTDRDRLWATMIKSARSMGIVLASDNEIEIIGLHVDAFIERWDH